MAAFADTVALDERQPGLPVQTAVISLADDILHVQRTVIGKVQTTVKPSKKSTSTGRTEEEFKPRSNLSRNLQECITITQGKGTSAEFAQAFRDLS